MTPRDLPRRTFTAPQPYWDTLDEIIQQGHATSASGALRHVIDTYRRSQQQQALTDSARQLNNDDWFALAGTDNTTHHQPKWSQLVADEQD